MDTRRLYYFVKIVDIGTISRAAVFLNLAQPALSQHIAALESEFDRQLLVRSRKGVTPTTAGQALYRYAQGMLRLEDSARHEIRDGNVGPSGVVSIGLASFGSASTFAVNILAKVRERYPNVVLHFVENLTVVMSQAVIMGLIDAAIIFDPGPLRGVQFETISEEDLYLVASPRLHVADPGARDISVENLAKVPLFMPRAQHTLRRIVDRAFREKQLALSVAAEIEPSFTLQKAIERALGATCLPESLAREMFPSSDFQLLKIVSPTLRASTALCTPNQPSISEAPLAVVELIRHEIRLAQRNPRLTP